MEKMKRTISILFFAVIAFGLLTGCKTQDTDEPAASAVELLPSNILFGDGLAISRDYSSKTYINAVSGIGDGKTSYSSSVPATATVDSATGQVTLVAVGKTVITAKKSSTSTYAESSTSYTLTVTRADQDPAVAKYACAKNIATTPGKLKSLPIGTAGAPQTRGYVEYVPPNYASDYGWPCIINLHGDGELGDGKTEAALLPFYNSCLPGMINNGTWDRKNRFVVLSPQFVDYADRTGANVNTFIQYAKANYKIDVTRIYLTAVSGGGVALGSYLDTYSGGEAAAVLPVSCYAPPTNSKKWKSVPVWFLCGASDTTVHPENLITHYNALIAAGAPVKPKITLYTGVGHDSNSVNKSYSPELNDNTFETTFSGVPLVPYSNIYDWMLQYHK